MWYVQCNLWPPSTSLKFLQSLLHPFCFSESEIRHHNTVLFSEIADRNDVLYIFTVPYCSSITFLKDTSIMVIRLLQVSVLNLSGSFISVNMKWLILWKVERRIYISYLSNPPPKNPNNIIRKWEKRDFLIETFQPRAEMSFFISGFKSNG